MQALPVVLTLCDLIQPISKQNINHLKVLYSGLAFIKQHNNLTETLLFPNEIMIKYSPHHVNIQKCNSIFLDFVLVCPCQLCKKKNVLAEYYKAISNIHGIRLMGMQKKRDVSIRAMVWK